MKPFALLFAAAFPCVTLAAPVVNFHGEVARQTCQVTINGETDAVVLLPTVSVDDFNGAGSTAGLMLFTLYLTDCIAPSGTLYVGVNFLGHNVTPAGNLSNSAVNNPATDVAIQLASVISSPMVFNDVTRGATGIVYGGNTSSAPRDPRMYVRYITEGGNPTPGAVTAVAEYTLTYL